MAHLSTLVRVSETLGGAHAVGDFRDPSLSGAGRARIRSTVELYGVPANTFVRRRVRLYRESDGALLREVWSHATTGAYEFNWIDPTQRYTAIAYDHTGDHAAAVASGLTPEPMP